MIERVGSVANANDRARSWLRTGPLRAALQRDDDRIVWQFSAPCPGFRADDLNRHRAIKVRRPNAAKQSATRGRWSVDRNNLDAGVVEVSDQSHRFTGTTAVIVHDKIPERVNS